MADFYKVLKADPLGEPYTPNVPGAKPIQSYWCQVEGQEKDVMIGKQVRDDGQPALVPGQHVYGDLTYAKSQKGNEYWKFKSARVPEDVHRPADTPAQATAQASVGDVSSPMPAYMIPIVNQLKSIDAKLEAIIKWAEMTDEQDTAKEAAAAETPDTGVDEATQEELKELFGE